MHVLYDYQIFSLQELGGISRYFVELARRLPDYSTDIRTTVLAPVHINSYLANSPVHTIGRKVASFPGKHHVLPWVNRVSGRGFLKKQLPDIFHETYYSNISQPVRAPRILTVYDMIHERFPDQFHGVDLKIPALKKQAVARADHVIAISKSTRDDLMEYLGVSPEKITVIPLAPSFDTVDERADFDPTDRPYLLYVGLRGGVKNFQRFITAFGRSQILRSGFNVLCVGGGDFTVEEERLFRELKVPEQVRHLQADDSLLAALYANAALFVYPSLYEGFGLPLLEAMHCGCPVACSNAGSMPEIAGDAALYFDPLNEEEVASVLESIVQSQDMAHSLRQRGHEREKMFSWDLCVAQTAELYRRLI
ncbi:MAG TPA: glycosyltransferase family 1 protein [Desulfobulbus sp.]|nr:glycosyltransferase family 1 protein [Desulfobulbus sp.]